MRGGRHTLGLFPSAQAAGWQGHSRAMQCLANSGPMVCLGPFGACRKPVQQQAVAGPMLKACSCWAPVMGWKELEAAAPESPCFGFAL